MRKYVAVEGASFEESWVYVLSPLSDEATTRKLTGVGVDMEVPSFGSDSGHGWYISAGRTSCDESCSDINFLKEGKIGLLTNLGEGSSKVAREVPPAITVVPEETISECTRKEWEAKKNGNKREM